MRINKSHSGSKNILKNWSLAYQTYLMFNYAIGFSLIFFIIELVISQHKYHQLQLLYDAFLFTQATKKRIGVHASKRNVKANVAQVGSLRKAVHHIVIQTCHIERYYSLIIIDGPIIVR